MLEIGKSYTIEQVVTPEMTARAIGSGGLEVFGLGNGRQKHLYVPYANTDFIFTVIGEEAGFIGAAITILLLSIVLWRGMRIALGAGELYGRLVAAGVVAWLAFQTFENIGMCIGMMPITGIPLPFISFGSSSMMIQLLTVGIVQSIWRHRSGAA